MISLNLIAFPETKQEILNCKKIYKYFKSMKS